MVMPVRIGLIIYSYGESVEQLVAVINSIRKQSQVPYFTRIIANDMDVRFAAPVVEAVDNLRLFCPDVVVLVGSEDPNRKLDDLVMAGNSMADKEYDVLVVMDADVVLPIDTLFHMTGPYLYLDGLLTVDAVVFDDRFKIGVFQQLFVRVVARSLISGYYKLGRIGVLSAARKVMTDANLKPLKLPLWEEIHTHETAEKKLTLYY